MFKKKMAKKIYDKEKERPVIHASICTGEQVAGFKDMRTGRFTEIMLIQNQADLDDFLEAYGLLREEVKKEY